MFSEREQQRYQRHLQLASFGHEGQSALNKSHVCVVGLGGLGCPAALYLAAAGVGRLTLVDGDTVSLSNLQRQVLFTEADLEQNKAEVAARHLTARNSDIEIEVHAGALVPDSAEALLASTDIVLDCTDNFHTRYLINDVCYYLDIPWVYASVLGFAGQMALFRKGHGCFRCLFPELREVPDCNQAGVLGAVPGVLGAQQALAAIRYLSGLHEEQARLFSFDGMGLQMRSVKLSPSPDCPLCAGGETWHDRLPDYAPRRFDPVPDITVQPSDFARFVQDNDPLLVDVRPAEEHQAGNLGGINIPAEHLTTELESHREEGRKVLLYCLMGKRSAMAASVLAEQGFEDILSLEGGIQGQAN
ncbi:MAG: ThiF family adenylyltransferase [Halioglobus sp.]